MATQPKPKPIFYVVTMVANWPIRNFEIKSRVREYLSADCHISRFPKDLDVSVKATLLGAALLIDFAFFES